MELFDSHCHIDVDAFDDDRSDVIDAARAAGVAEMLVPAVQRATWPQLLALCGADPQLYPALGLHPVYLQSHADGDVAALAEQVAATRPVAIGEIGLDWQLRSLDRDRQQRLLDAQLEVAEQTRLPVVLHVRKAHEPMLATLRRYRLNGGFCHAFNGSLQQASRYLDLGFRLGFGGMLTFERSTHLRTLAAALPLDALVLETDAPDMTGAAHRYQRNSPAYLPEVLETLATLRNDAVDLIARATTDNARQVLRLPVGDRRPRPNGARRAADR
ncbi:MAG: TatD family hydrolase [Gammaproteobacteria bacterium]|nr:TatD family hydrolase [Gammaproteobacteria bacterium]